MQKTAVPGGGFSYTTLYWWYCHLVWKCFHLNFECFYQLQVLNKTILLHFCKFTIISFLPLPPLHGRVYVRSCKYGLKLVGNSVSHSNDSDMPFCTLHLPLDRVLTGKQHIYLLFGNLTCICTQWVDRLRYQVYIDTVFTQAFSKPVICKRKHILQLLTHKSSIAHWMVYSIYILIITYFAPLYMSIHLTAPLVSGIFRLVIDI